MALFESPSGFSANVHPSSGDKSSLDLSQSSPEGRTKVKGVSGWNGQVGHPAAAGALGPQPLDLDCGVSSSSAGTGACSVDPEQNAIWDAQLARARAEKSRLKAVAAEDQFSALSAEIEVEKAANKRKTSRSAKSGDSDGGGGARSTRSARGARSFSSGSSLIVDNLRAQEDAAKRQIENSKRWTSMDPNDWT